MFGGNQFETLGVNQDICEKFPGLGWMAPTEIQKKVLPLMLKGNDVIALAETGSGKTGAFAIPILQKLYERPKSNFALIITPTHELAVQIQAEFMKISGEDDLKVLTLIGGNDSHEEVKMLKSNLFHIIIGTPGKVIMHLQQSKALNLRNTKFLILDEADRMLSDDFISEIEIIVNAMSKNYQTCLFSATMTNKLEKLEAACLKNPIRVEVSQRHQTVKKLKQQCVFIHDDDERIIFLIWKLQNICSNSEDDGQSSVIVFTQTKKESKLLFKVLREFEISVVMLHSDMERTERQDSIDKFKSGNVSVLVATDVASRGLDIPSVGLVINFSVPEKSETYQHRVGRTARAGRTGLAITLVTVYTYKDLSIIEKDLGQKMTKIVMPIDKTADIKRDLVEVLSNVQKVMSEDQYRENEINKIKKNKHIAALDRKRNVAFDKKSKSALDRKRKHDE